MFIYCKTRCIGPIVFSGNCYWLIVRYFARRKSGIYLYGSIIEAYDFEGWVGISPKVSEVRPDSYRESERSCN